MIHVKMWSLMLLYICPAIPLLRFESRLVTLRRLEFWPLLNRRSRVLPIAHKVHGSLHRLLLGVIVKPAADGQRRIFRVNYERKFAFGPKLNPCPVFAELRRV
jgi:hypothetical protein